LNTALFEHGMVMTYSIGDNLVKTFSERISKDESKFSCAKRLDAKRNVRKFLSEYMVIYCWESRSVWIAQREGRTKDGNDATNPGVLKMVGMASNGMDLMDYFKTSK
jgi:hypothetical protein